MLTKSKIYITLAVLVMLVFFIVKTSVLLEITQSTPITRGIEYICFLLLIPIFVFITKEYSSSKNNRLINELKEFDRFVDRSVLVSRADAKGKITYVNKKFQEVSGWSLEEAIGKDHSIVNSGTHSKEFWSEMYRVTVKERDIWNAVCTNRNKKGELYWVDSYIKAEFDRNNKLKGFMSIRYDVTELKKKEVEIRNRMSAINRSNAVIEFDLEGNIIFANELFIQTMGYSSQDEIIGKHHRIFLESEYSKSDEYSLFWEKLKNGILFSNEITRVRKDGSLIYLQATYNPIIEMDGKIHRIMKIATDISDSYEQRKEIEKKNTYLEHAAKILRHDMHSGINTYIPRGVSSLERRLTEDDIKNLKIEAPLRMVKEGLKHAQKVYKGVYEFTNLVKKDVVLTKSDFNIKEILDDYLSSTSYKSQVLLDDNLPTLEINDALFCTSIDNLIRNGLKYNDSPTKMVKVYYEKDKQGEYIVVQDNGRGMSQKDFDELSKPYVRKKDQKESGTGLGLNICQAILKEHGFSITAQKVKTGGTKLKIKI
jgi:PAS domain S-box-containing protein